MSREVIADSIELVARGNGFDAIVALVGCDKTIPGAVMALARLDVPGLVLYGGSIAPGHVDGRDVTIQDVFEAIGAHAAGALDDRGLRRLEDGACPGAGACGGQFTANTMAAVCEFLGISPMGSASAPAVDPAKASVAYDAGRLVMSLRRGQVKPRRIITRQAIGLLAVVCITGQVGSRLIGSDAFQETDITGVTLPVTKHNYLVRRADDIAPAVREAFYLAKGGRPGPVLIDITKDAQQASCTFDWAAAAPKPHGRPPMPSQRAEHRRAVALINAAERPVSSRATEF